MIQTNNKSITAYLQQESILRQTSIRTECDNKIHVLFDETSSKVLERINTTIKIREKSDYHFKQHTFLSKLADKTNYQHYSALLEETDILAEFLNLTRIIEANGQTFIVKPQENIQSEHMMKESFEKVQENINSFKFTLIFIGGVIIAIIIGLIILIFVDVNLEIIILKLYILF